MASRVPLRPHKARLLPLVVKCSLTPEVGPLERLLRLMATVPRVPLRPFLIGPPELGLRWLPLVLVYKFGRTTRVPIVREGPQRRFTELGMSVAVPVQFAVSSRQARLLGFLVLVPVLTQAPSEVDLVALTC